MPCLNVGTPEGPLRPQLPAAPTPQCSKQRQTIITGYRPTVNTTALATSGSQDLISWNSPKEGTPSSPLLPFCLCNVLWPQLPFHIPQLMMWPSSSSESLPSQSVDRPCVLPAWPDSKPVSAGLGDINLLFSNSSTNLFSLKLLSSLSN